jgi:hypothetical protein
MTAAEQFGQLFAIQFAFAGYLRDLSHGDGVFAVMGFFIVHVILQI